MAYGPQDHSTSSQASEELIRALLSATGQGVYGVDLAGNCTFANAACAQILGYESGGALVDRNMHDLIHHTRPDGQPNPVEECRIYQAFRLGQGTHLDNEVVWRADGKPVPVEYWSYPVFLRGAISGCVVAFSDITERKLAEDSLRDREEVVRALLLATGQGIYGTDLEGNCTFANPACLRLLGYETDAELLGQNMHGLIHHTRVDRTPYPVRECHIYQAFREQRGVHLEDEIVWRADGTSFPVEYWSQPTFFRGQLSGCVVAFVDITDRKRAERELRESREQAEKLLLNILPKEVAVLLKAGESPIAEAYADSTILFADLVGFTPLSETMSANELVELLREVFSYFDTLAEKHGVEKIKTIGDCYMVAAGVPVRRDDHAQALARMALEIQAYVDSNEFAGRKLKFRIGMNSGPIVAGVLGHKKFSYDLWGDAVNTASRMESAGQPGCIQITRSTYELLAERFVCQPIGHVAVKGKGEIEAWHLVGERAKSALAAR